MRQKTEIQIRYDDLLLNISTSSGSNQNTRIRNSVFLRLVETTQKIQQPSTHNKLFCKTKPIRLANFFDQSFFDLQSYGHSEYLPHREGLSWIFRIILKLYQRNYKL